MRFMRAATEMMHTGIVSESFYLTKTVTLITNSNSCFFSCLSLDELTENLSDLLYFFSYKPSNFFSIRHKSLGDFS